MHRGDADTLIVYMLKYSIEVQETHFVIVTSGRARIANSAASVTNGSKKKTRALDWFVGWWNGHIDWLRWQLHCEHQFPGAEIYVIGIASTDRSCKLRSVNLVKQ